MTTPWITFTKGAGLIPALAFLLASTNLVVELGIIIVKEYVVGVFLMLPMWIVVKLSLPKNLKNEIVILCGLREILPL